MASVCEACKKKELCSTYKDAKAFYTDLKNFGCMHFRLGKPTNADRIRSMSDEELAEKFFLFPCVHVLDDKVICKDDGCKKCWMRWLREEAK